MLVYIKFNIVYMSSREDGYAGLKDELGAMVFVRRFDCTDRDVVTALGEALE